MEQEGFIKKVLGSFVKTHKEINSDTEELDARYRWLKYFVEDVLGYSGNDYHIEKKRADITIFDEQQRSVIKIETKRLKIVIPAMHSGKAYSLIKEYREKEEWLNNGDLQVIVNIPAGLQLEFYDKLNGITHGSSIVEEIKQ